MTKTAVIPGALAAVDWGYVILLFIGAAAGAGTRIAISGTQNFWKRVGTTWWHVIPEKRSIGEMVAAGVGAIAADRLGIAEVLPILGPELYAKADIVGRASLFFGYSYVGGHVWRAFEFRRTNGNGTGAPNGGQ